jgi:hypothetical protein
LIRVKEMRKDNNIGIYAGISWGNTAERKQRSKNPVESIAKESKQKE